MEQELVRLLAGSGAYLRTIRSTRVSMRALTAISVDRGAAAGLRPRAGVDARPRIAARDPQKAAIMHLIEQPRGRVGRAAEPVGDLAVREAAVDERAGGRFPARG